MKFSLLSAIVLFTACLSLAASYAQLPWTELNHSNFEEAIASESHTLALFYSEDNQTAHHLVEILRSAERYAETLNVTVAFTKINTDKNKNITKQYKIDSTPTLMLFIDRKGIKFNRELTSQELEYWLSYLLNRKLFIIENKDDFESFNGRDDKSKIIAIYPNEGMLAEKELLERLLSKGVFLDNDIISVGVASDPNVVNEIIPNGTHIPSLCLIKSFESPVPIAVFKGNLSSEEAIREFISVNNLPTLIEFEEDTISRLFQGYVNNHIYLFLPNKSEAYRSLIDEFKKSAEYNYKHDLYYERIYHILFYANDLYEDIQMNFGLNNVSKLPAVFLTEIRKATLNRYQFDTSSGISYESLKTFIEAFRMRNLTLYRPSEDIPSEESQELVRKIVEKSFRQDVILSPYSIQVMFCNDMVENPICSMGQKIFNFIANRLETEGKSLRLGIIDSLRNEVEHFSRNREIEIYLFNKGSKHRPKKFEFVLTLKSLVAWMNTISPEVSLSLLDNEEEIFIKNELNEHEQKIIRSNMEILETMRLNSQSKVEEVQEIPKMLGPAKFRDL